jgi:hypothetical protein
MSAARNHLYDFRKMDFYYLRSPCIDHIKKAASFIGIKKSVQDF